MGDVTVGYIPPKHTIKGSKINFWLLKLVFEKETQKYKQISQR